jgi:protease I
MKLRSFADERSRSWIVKMSLTLLCLASLAVAGMPKQSPSGPARQPQAAPVRRAPARLQAIQLPEPANSSAVTFEQAVDEMQKVQAPANQRLDSAKIGQLAWAIRSSMPTPVAAGTAPAPAGDDSPMRAFFVLPEGLFSYEPSSHTLQPIAEGDARLTLGASLVKQPLTPVGGCQIVLAGSPRDYTARYGTKSRTVMAMQAGKIAQNIQLQAVAHGLAFVAVDAVEGADVRRAVRVPRNYEPLYVAIVGYPAGQTPATAVQPASAQSNYRVLLVVAPRGFQDQELFDTRRALELAGVQATVASTRTGQWVGMAGGRAQAALLLSQGDVDNFDGVVFFADGRGRDVRSAASRTGASGFRATQILAAIGTAPSILAGAGLLRGTRVTAYLTEQERIVQAGGFYTGNAAEKDGLIITATGPLATSLFTKAILDGLAEVR